jgi:hypothetical protein
MRVTDVLVGGRRLWSLSDRSTDSFNERRKLQTSQSVAGPLGAIEQKAFDAYVIDFKLPDDATRTHSLKRI